MTPVSCDRATVNEEYNLNQMSYLFCSPSLHPPEHLPEHLCQQGAGDGAESPAPQEAQLRGLLQRARPVRPVAAGHPRTAGRESKAEPEPRCT